MRLSRVLSLVSFALVLLFSAKSHAQQVLLTDDTQINNTASTTNYGTSTTLTINSTQAVLLKFDLADILPVGTTSSQVAKARLILFPNKVTTTGSINVYQTSSDWVETSVTWGSRPSESTSVAGSASVVRSNEPVFISLTALIQGWISNPSSNHGVEIKPSGSASFIIDSKENTATSHPAVLQIDLTGPVGATGATGATGPKGATGSQGPAGSGLASVNHDSNLTGSGTSASPLALANSLNVPYINVSSSDSNNSAIRAYNTGTNTIGVYAYGTAYALFAYSTRVAAELDGDVEVSGTLYKASGAFKIDHPMDPENKYLVHSFVESPDMKNVYDGTVTTDGSGLGTVALPDWFESLNRDFRYQLTVIGQFSQAIIASEVTNNRFVIRTDKPNVKVSWQVTGIRHDAWANAHRLPTEVDKSDTERGHYPHPELFNHAGEPNLVEMSHPLPTSAINH